MSDATIITEMPPLRAAYAPIGQQATVAVTGNHARRVIFGALNIATGHLELLITPAWEALTWQTFLRQIRSIWRGWQILLFIDRGSPHTAAASRSLATSMGIGIRWLPVAVPELNAVEGLWRNAKNQSLANHTTDSIDDSVNAVCHYLLSLPPKQRLQKAGVLSGKFWLTN